MIFHSADEVKVVLMILYFDSLGSHYYHHNHPHILL